MTNVTLSVDERVLAAARKVAAGRGTSVNALIRRYLEHLAGSADVEATIAEFRALSFGHGRTLGGWRFNRDEIHER